jgi:hypothetical protein
MVARFQDRAATVEKSGRKAHFRIYCGLGSNVLTSYEKDFWR